MIRLRTPHYGNGARLDGERVILSKVGAVAINLHRPVTRKRNSTGKWYVGFVTEQETQARTDVPETAVGIDVGLEKFASLSTGETIPNPRFFRRDARDLQRASRRLSAEEKRTPERAKRRKVVGRIHERIANRRKDFAHQFSRTLVARFGVIVFEDLSIAQMLKHHHLAKSIADATWNQLNHYPSCKVEEAGTRVVVVDHAARANAVADVRLWSRNRLVFACIPVLRVIWSSVVI